MAINKVPNNYYNDTNIRRDKINTIIDHVNELDTHAVVPTPAAGDLGKIIKVGSDGYELAEDEGLPTISSSDNNAFLRVVNGEWVPFKITAATLGIIVAFANGGTSTTSDIGISITTSPEMTFNIFGNSYGFNIIANRILTGKPIRIDNQYYGFAYPIDSNSFGAYVYKDDILYRAVITASDVTYTKVSYVNYISVTVTTGLNAITLPDSMTFDDLKALLDVSTVYIVDDDTSDIYSIERYDGSSAIFRHIGISSAYVSVDSIEFNSLGGTYSEARVEIYTPTP